VRRLVLCVLLLAALPLSAQKTGSPIPEGGILSLVQDFGRARYRRCSLTVYYARPRLPSIDRIELSCTPLPMPMVPDVVASRPLSVTEANVVANLAAAANLYSGGHVGRYAGQGSEGPWERLEVSRCCGNDQTVILITDGNPTFAGGSRRELLTILSTWRTELLPKLRAAR
jgi:hypothetical protein